MGRNLPWRSSLVLLFIYSSLAAQDNFLSADYGEMHTEVSFLFTHKFKAESFPLEEEELMKPYLQNYTSNWGKTYLSSLTDRSVPFRYTLSYSIWKSDLPVDLIYLPLIESAWNPRSISASGAQGLWQFMENSIPEFFVLDRWRDDRRDIFLSTEAAVAKIQYNLNRVNQNWLLALAGYNCGINLISRNLELVDRPTYWGLRNENLIPEQTRDYIPRFLAVNHILHRKVQYGLELNWEKSPVWRQVPLEANIFLPALAQELNIQRETLFLINAELNEWVSPPDDPFYRLKVPNTAEITLERLISEKPFTDNILSGNVPQPVLTLYEVQEGDSLWDIAENFSCTVGKIKELNGLESSEIHPGMLLFLP